MQRRNSNSEGSKLLQQLLEFNFMTLIVTPFDDGSGKEEIILELYKDLDDHPIYGLTTGPYKDQGLLDARYRQLLLQLERYVTIQTIKATTHEH